MQLTKIEPTIFNLSSTQMQLNYVLIALIKHFKRYKFIHISTIDKSKWSLASKDSFLHVSFDWVENTIDILKRFGHCTGDLVISARHKTELK